MSGNTYGLPTYPIFNHMQIGERTPDELELLLDHGEFKSDHSYHYQRIVKCGDTYELWDGDTQFRFREDEKLDSAPSLAKLLKSKHIVRFALAKWYWYGREEGR